MKEQFSKRIRVFAGPNGSGKTTVINDVKRIVIDGYPIDFGTVVNADEIANQLRREGMLDFSPFGFLVTAEEFAHIYKDSNLLAHHTQDRGNPLDWYRLENNVLRIVSIKHVELVAQVTAWVILQKLLVMGRKISFETVFSSQEKINLLAHAQQLGYKVYLYFISTESATINVQRVLARVAQGGHPVGEEQIRKRYERSLQNAYPALKFVHRAFFLDNSSDEGHRQVANVLVSADGTFHWDNVDVDNPPKWFIDSCVQHDQFLRAIITRN